MVAARQLPMQLLAAEILDLIRHLAQHLLHTAVAAELALARVQQHIVAEVVAVLHLTAAAAMALQHKLAWVVPLDTEMQVVPLQQHNQEQVVVAPAAQA